MAEEKIERIDLCLGASYLPLWKKGELIIRHEKICQLFYNLVGLTNVVFVSQYRNYHIME